MPTHIITATHLKGWQGRQPQGDLPTLIRDLVWSTARGLTHISFPGGDSVYRPGFDGVVIAEADTIFVPAGKSIWEIGTDANPKTKANGDYKKRTKNPDPDATFIFVTPREFQDKDDWAKEKRAEGKWRDVRVYDSDDLENWLSISPSVSSLWIEKIANISPEKVLPALYTWDEWETAMDGMLSPAMLTAGVKRNACCHAVLDWIDMDPPSILRLKSYSPMDGQLFLVGALSTMDGYGDWLVRCVFTDDEATLRQIASSETSQLIVTSVNNMGLAKKALINGHKICILSPHSASNFSDHDTVVEIPLRLDAYEAANELEKLGMPRTRAEQTLRKSGRMLMALRREVAGEHPCWASPEIRNVMAPVVLASGWNEKLDEDREALESLSGTEYAEIEKTLKTVRTLEESPIQYIEPYWKLLSPIDAWRCLGPQLTKTDFDRLRAVVFAAFTAPDPVMELPAKDRWAAAIYQKRTPYSGMIRAGLLETLAIIAEFGETFGLTGLTAPQSWIDNLATDIFSECRKDIKKWISLSAHFPVLAEAAPGPFLSELEWRLDNDQSSLIGLFDDSDPVFHSTNRHVQLMWGLERLAWFPQHLARVVEILLRLHKIAPDGNMHPRPFGTLQNPFCFFRPQTMASWEHRKELLKALLGKYPETTRELMLSLTPGSYGRSVGNSQQPDWREVIGTSRFRWDEVFDKTRWVVDQLIPHSQNIGPYWADIVEKYKNFRPDSRERITDRLLELSTKGDMTDTACLRARIRELVNHERDYCKKPDFLEEIKVFDAIYENLEPENLVERHGWLFEQWPSLPDRKGKKHQDRSEQLQTLRMRAIKDVYDSKGLVGIKELATQAAAPSTVGYAYGKDISKKQWDELYASMELNDGPVAEFIKPCIEMACDTFGKEWTIEAIERGKSSGADFRFLAHCCLSLPRDFSTWEIVESLGPEGEAYYWKMVFAYSFFESGAESKETEYVLQKLIQSGRMGLLMDHAADKSSTLSYDQRCEILEAFINNPVVLATKSDLMKILEILRTHPDRDEKQIMGYEWVFAEIYCIEKTQLLLHKAMVSDPEFFQELLQYMTGDMVCIPYNAPDRAYTVLSTCRTLPGEQDDGSVDEHALSNWVDEALKRCEGIGEGLVDSRIGHILAHAPTDKDGLFPCLPVRNVFERVTNEDMESGFITEMINKRGTWSKSPYEGGRQERALAQQFRDQAEKIQIKWPKVASTLERLARSYDFDAKREDRSLLHEEMMR